MWYVSIEQTIQFSICKISYIGSRPALSLVVVSWYCHYDHVISSVHHTFHATTISWLVCDNIRRNRTLMISANYHYDIWLIMGWPKIVNIFTNGQNIYLFTHPSKKYTQQNFLTAKYVLKMIHIQGVWNSNIFMQSWKCMFFTLVKKLSTMMASWQYSPNDKHTNYIIETQQNIFQEISPAELMWDFQVE